MYWSVLGCVVGIEYVAEWLISWYVCHSNSTHMSGSLRINLRVPFYYPIKTLFLLYLALPQTAGSSWLYATRVQPFFAAHESEIDNALTRLKTFAYEYVQRLFRTAWRQVSMSMGQAPSAEPQRDVFDEGGITGEAAVRSAAPPTLNNPAAGPSQLLQTLWRTYGPAVVAAGGTLLSQSQNPSAGLNSPTPSRLNSLHSVAERRKLLEEELASLPSDSAARPYDLSPEPVLMPRVGDNSSRSSSSGSLRERAGSSNMGKSTFEEVEVPSDVESETPLLPPGAPQGRTSWFGGWGAAKGYEKVKTDKTD